MPGITSYLRHRKKAVNAYGLHSPLMFDLYNRVFKPRWNKNEMNEPDALRNQLLRDSRIIDITDLGAGSKKFSSNQRKIKSIAATSVKRKKYARLMSRLIKHFDCKTVIELGTSLGVTTVYLSKSTNGKVHTIEGCPALFEEARKNITSEGCSNVDARQGAFADVLPTLLENLKSFDLAFIDGWHTYDGTMHVFEELMKYANSSSIIVIDDIHWSAGMEKAWNEIIKHGKITASIDIFEMGIIFLNTNLSRETFCLKY